MESTPLAPLERCHPPLAEQLVAFRVHTDHTQNRGLDSTPDLNSACAQERRHHRVAQQVAAVLGPLGTSHGGHGGFFVPPINDKIYESVQLGPHERSHPRVVEQTVAVPAKLTHLAPQERIQA